MFHQNNKFFEEDLIKLRLNVDNREQLLIELGNLLTAKGYVKKDYVEALLAREKEFPTGIWTGKWGVAIPHTDAKYVNRTAIAVGTLAKSVPFEIMGCNEGTVDVNIVFVLAINNADTHLELLQRLMNIFQNDKVMEGIINSFKPRDVMEILNRELLEGR